VKEALIAQEALVELIAAHAGIITDSTGKPQKVNRADPNAPSVIYDAVVVLGGELREGVSYFV
jgi:catalase